MQSNYQIWERERERERERESVQEIVRAYRLFSFLVMSVQYHNLSKFVDVKGKIQYFSDLVLLMLIILILILIESRSILIVYWLCDRKLINAYFEKYSIQNIYLQKDFFLNLNDVLWNILQCAYMSLFMHTLYSITLLEIANAN